MSTNPAMKKLHLARELLRRKPTIKIPQITALKTFYGSKVLCVYKKTSKKRMVHEMQSCFHDREKCVLPILNRFNNSKSKTEDGLIPLFSFHIT